MCSENLSDGSRSSQTQRKGMTASTPEPALGPWQGEAGGVRSTECEERAACDRRDHSETRGNLQARAARQLPLLFGSATWFPAPSANALLRAGLGVAGQAEAVEGEGGLGCTGGRCPEIESVLRKALALVASSGAVIEEPGEPLHKAWALCSSVPLPCLHHPDCLLAGHR